MWVANWNCPRSGSVTLCFTQQQRFHPEVMMRQDNTEGKCLPVRARSRVNQWIWLPINSSAVWFGETYLYGHIGDKRDSVAPELQRSSQCFSVCCHESWQEPAGKVKNVWGELKPWTARWRTFPARPAPPTPSTHFLPSCVHLPIPFRNNKGRHATFICGGSFIVAFNECQPALLIALKPYEQQ